MSKPKMPKDLLDQLCAELRGLEPPPGASDQSAARVWNRLSETGPIPALAGSALTGCADVRSDLEAIAGGARLDPARQMLLEDHLQSCVACRHRLKQLRGLEARPEPVGREVRHPKASWRPPLAGVAALAAAAAIVAAVLLYRAFAPVAGEATVLADSGPLYQLSAAAELTPVRAQRLAYGDWLRTGAQADALLRLSDGSRVEVRGQSEFRLAAARRGTTLDLRDGAVIVEAAKQTAGRRFYVATRNALVSVKGTVFAVNSGLRGARVAVLAGQVQVDHGGQEVLLSPGQQFTTSADLSTAPLGDAFAWSRDSQHYLALLASLSSLRNDLRQVPYPGLRYASSLLPLVPADTVFYAALPNLSGTLAESFQVVQQHLAEDPVLRSWWGSRQHGDTSAMLRELQRLGADLGDEVVIAASELNRGAAAPLLLAQTNNPQQLAARLRELARQGNGHPRVAVVADPARAAAVAGADFYAWLDNGLLAGSPQLGPLRALETELASSGAASFADTPFYARIAAAYQQGVSVLVAADARRIEAELHQPGVSTGKGPIGFENLDYFLAVQQVTAAGTADRADLSFTGARQGVASWLGPPAPMGALAFVSPHPQAVLAAQIKQPAAMIQDLLRIAGSSRSDLDGAFANFDPASLAAPLGREFAFALDGPLLPTPAWKVIVEVDDPPALQQALGQMVAAWNEKAREAGRPMLATATEQSGGQTYYRLSLAGSPTEVDYTFSGGYLLIAPRLELLAQALRYRDADYNLTHSQPFLSALPRDSEVNCSAVFYHNLSPTLVSLLSWPAASARTNKKKDSLRRWGAEAPGAACAYATSDEIRFAMNGPTAPFGLGIGSLLGMPNGFDLHRMFERARGARTSDSR